MIRPIAVAGHICLDLSPSLGLADPTTPAQASRLSDLWEPGALASIGPLGMRLGGAVANTGRALIDLGAPVTAITTVGEDALGSIVRSLVAEEGFQDPRIVVCGDHATSYSVILEAPGVDRAILHHTGANGAFDGAGIDSVDADILHLGYPSLLPALSAGGGEPLISLLERARDRDMTTSVDLAVIDRTTADDTHDWNRILTATAAVIDVLSPSLDDLTSAIGIEATYSPSLVDDLAQRFLEAGVGVVAISAGAHGIAVRTGNQARLRRGGAALRPLADRWANASIDVPAFPVSHRVTTNGAGDASTAGLLFALAAGWAPADAVMLAASSAACIIGGQRPTPNAVAGTTPALAPLFMRSTVA